MYPALTMQPVRWAHWKDDKAVRIVNQWRPHDHSHFRQRICKQYYSHHRAQTAIADRVNVFPRIPCLYIAHGLPGDAARPRQNRRVWPVSHSLKNIVRSIDEDIQPRCSTFRLLFPILWAVWGNREQWIRDVEETCWGVIKPWKPHACAISKH